MVAPALEPQLAGTTKQIQIKCHKQLNSTQSSLSTKIRCCWLVFSAFGGTDHTIVMLKPVASTQYKSREKRQQKQLLFVIILFMCTHHLSVLIINFACYTCKNCESY